MIREISFKLYKGKLALQVKEDYDWGYDWNGLPNSLSDYRVRDAEPNDLIALTQRGFINTQVDIK